MWHREASAACPTPSRRRLAAVAAHVVQQEAVMSAVMTTVPAAAAAEQPPSYPLPPCHPPTAVFGGGPSEAQRQHLVEKGYVIIKDAVDPALMPALLEAGRRVAPRIRAGELRDRMLTPLDGEPVFAEYYACRELLRYVLHFIQRPIEQLSLGAYHNHKPAVFLLRKFPYEKRSAAQAGSRDNNSESSQNKRSFSRRRVLRLLAERRLPGQQRRLAP